jgi:heme-degrading monooxygenase HmoA
MHVRLLKAKFGLDGVDEAVRIFQESVLPGCKKQKGFKGGCFLDDRETGECVLITMWKTEKDMLASEESRFFQSQLIKFMPFFKSPPVRESYEVVVSTEEK